MPNALPPEVYTPLTVGQWVFILIGIPVVFAILVTLVHVGPGWTRGGRHRPGQEWEAAPVLVDGGVTVDPEVPDASGSDDTDRGSSARW